MDWELNSKVFNKVTIHFNILETRLNQFLGTKSS